MNGFQIALTAIAGGALGGLLYAILADAVNQVRGR